MLTENLEFRRIHLAILFGCGIVFKGLWKHVSSAHMILFTVCIGVLYVAKLMKPKDPLDAEIEKLDAALASEDPSAALYKTRPTTFIVPEADRGLFTDRQRQYSSLLGGTHAQRRKFLRKKNSIHDVVDVNAVVDPKVIEPKEIQNEKPNEIAETNEQAGHGIPQQRASRQFMDS